MVETRSGLSVEPDEGESSGGRATPDARRKDTARSGGGTAIAERSGGRGRRRASQAGAGGGAGMGDSQAYMLLALALGLLAMPCALTPKLVARAAFGSAAEPPEDQHSHTLGLLSCGLAAAAAAALALEECARKHMLHTFTADTLKLGLAAFAAGNLLLLLLYPATLSASAAILAVISQAATLALPASQLFVAAEDRGRVLRDFRRLPSSMRHAVWLRKPSLLGGLYLLLTAAFPAAGLAYFFAPQYTLYHALGYVYGKSTLCVWRAVGWGLATLAPAITYTLKDKAENELLARSVPRTLNLGLMGAAVGHLLIFGPILNMGHGGFLLPGLVATWAAALLASMAGLAAPELPAAAPLLEQTAEAAREE